METITLAAPAKINLSLRVLGKRPDGYHQIETLMAPLLLEDGIEISHAGSGIAFQCNEPDLPTGSGNLCVKAAEAFFKETGIVHGVSITLLKRIPHGAGLGGGSSDAAAVIRGLNTLFDEPLVPGEMERLGASIGSDVPFFFLGAPAICRGRGEVVEEAPPLPERKILLIKPPFPVSTAWAYGRYEEAQARTDTGVLPGRLGTIVIVNDLEIPVFEKYLLLPVMKEWLKSQPGVESCFMSGSGSTMVAIMDPREPPLTTEPLRADFQERFGSTCWMAETAFAPARGGA